MLKEFFNVVARICLATIFLHEAYDSIKYYYHTKETMANYGFTWNQDFVLKLTIGVLILGGILLILGYQVKFASFLLLSYIVPITFIVYSFWNDDKSVQAIQQLHFMKNIAIIGGLIMINIYGSGKWSIKRVLDVWRLPS